MCNKFLYCTTLTGFYKFAYHKVMICTNLFLYGIMQIRISVITSDSKTIHNLSYLYLSQNKNMYWVIMVRTQYNSFCETVSVWWNGVSSKTLTAIQHWKRLTPVWAQDAFSKAENENDSDSKAKK